MTGLCWRSREIAYALAYALTDTRPDAELLQAASTGKLATPEQVATQVVRMLGETKLPKPRILGFFREYFEYGGAIDVFKDEALNRNRVPEVLVSDTDRLIMHFYEQDNNALRELLTTNKSFVQFAIDSKTKKPTRMRARNLEPTSPTACRLTGSGFPSNRLPCPVPNEPAS